MNDTITLNNVSFRIVGNFMRVNQPYTAVKTPPNVPFTIDLPSITMDQPPTVGALMDALERDLPGLGYDFKFKDLPTGPTREGTLDKVSFGPKGEKGFELSALDLTQRFEGIEGPNGEKLGVAWQYYVFYKQEDENTDRRVEVSGRARYRESVMLQDNCRVIWRLIVTYLNPVEGDKKLLVKENGVESVQQT
ncbi:MAG: hypothetical protein AAF744_03565 [Pseudomonadota bacterium]